MTLHSFKSISPHHIKNMQLICVADNLTGFYMMLSWPEICQLTTSELQTFESFLKTYKDSKDRLNVISLV